MLLNLAVEAGLPLVAVQSDDPINAQKVLGAILKQPVSAFPKATQYVSVQGVKKSTSVYDPGEVQKGGLYIMKKASPKLDWSKLYSHLAKVGATAIVVNPEELTPEMFNAGAIYCPEELVRKLVADYVDEDTSKDEIEALVSALSGLSYQNVVNLMLLAQAKAGELSSRAVRDVRRVFFGNVRGLQQENTEVGFYQPSPQLDEWLKLDGQLFLSDAPAILRPRGLLLDGPPGTGKTMGAKYIARALGLPLYRFDIGATMNKYVGESEKGLEAALEQADRCAPCVMLVDEVEKLFQSTGDSGVTTRALSKLLWWLQEHSSRVLTVMTTNDYEKLPPELVRPGRIDAKFYFGRLNADDALVFLREAAGSMAPHVMFTPKDVMALHKSIIDETAGGEGAPLFSHAYLHQRLLQVAKAKYLSANH